MQNPVRRALPLGRTLRALAAFVPIVAVVVSSAMFSASPVSAHTGFESSTPADQSSVAEPVELVTISFTGPATPVGDGFVALNASGVLQEPVSVSTLDDEVFTIRFDPPLAGGQVGIRWNVQAADTHPIEGAFSFTVTAPLPTTAAPTTEPATTTPASTAAASTTVGSEASTPAAPPSSAAVSGASDANDDDPEVAAGVADDTEAGSDSAVPVQSLDEFLTIDESRPGETTALLGRILGLIGATLALGAVAFGFSTLRGPRAEVRRFISATAGVAAVLVVGAAIEYVGVVRLGDESATSAWSTSPGFATVLRMLGGLALVVGMLVALRRHEVRDVRPARALSAAVIDDLTASEKSAGSEALVRWSPARSAWPVGLGIVAVLASFWFDGHTVSKGFRPLHAAVNTVHVAAGSVWFGGLVSLCAIAWLRHRRGRRAGVAELAVRFSRLATVALGAVVVAGVVMAFVVLDSFGDLTGTEWGQTLLLKTVAVGFAIAIGAYNHFRLVPALDAASDDDAEQLASRLRSTMTAEAIVLVFVVIVTASLVAAATV